MLNSKKAQIGETLTWIIATIIIILIMVVFIYISSSLAEKTKIIDLKDKVFSEKYKTNDIMLGKSLFVYLLIKDSSEKEFIYNQLKKDEELNKFYEDLDSKLKELEFAEEK